MADRICVMNARPDRAGRHARGHLLAPDRRASSRASSASNNLLPGRLGAARRAARRSIPPLGDLLGHRPAGPAANGAAVDLMVRPEAHPARRLGATNRIAARVVEVAFAGADVPGSIARRRSARR